MKKSAKRILGLTLCLVMVLSMLPVFALAAGTTVYCEAPETWSTCYVYTWDATGSTKFTGEWPGTAMTKNADGLWELEIPEGAVNVIFNNGSGSQTSDLKMPTDNKVKYVYASRTWAEMDEEPPVPEAAWYVAGTMNGWNPCDASFKMNADGDGTFSLTFALTAGDHALKVTNGSWDVNFGGSGAGGNYEFSLAEDGDVTVEFDGVGTVNVVGVEPAPTPDEGWYVAGTINGWNAADSAYIMADNGDGTYSLALTLEAGACSIKVTNGTWEVSYGGTGEGGNFDFEVVAPGNVVISFNTADNTVSVSGDVILPEPPQPEPIPAIEYIIVAGHAGLVGAEWDPTSEDAKMTANNGIYTITFEDVAVGVYEFKFTANGTWDVNWASGEAVVAGETATAWFNAQGNSNIEITEEGSDVTITLDLTTMDEFGEGGTFVVDVKTTPDYGIVGDVTGDTKVNMADVAKAFAHVRNKNKLTDEGALFRADATGDGKINMADIARIFAHVRGKNPLF